MMSQTSRNQRWDVLRGIAILGILPVNIWVFGWPLEALDQPEIGLKHGLWNGLAWGFVTLVFEHKMVLILAFLMGMGLSWMAQRGRSQGMIIRRLLVLAGLGLVHGYLIWWGDILWLLAISGLLAWFSRDLSKARLILVGLCCLSTPSLVLALWWFWDVNTFGLAFEPWPVVMIDQALDTYRADWLAQFQQRWPQALWMQTLGLLTYGVWHLFGAMLLGLAMQGSDWQVKPSFALILLCIGVLLQCIVMVAQWQATGVSLGVAAMLLPISGAVQSAAYIMLFIWGWQRLQSHHQVGLNQILGAAGRLSLSLYLCQSVLLSILFYGHGFGLMGHLSLWQLATLALLLMPILALLAQFWEQRFAQGPAEWLWRRLSY